MTICDTTLKPMKPQTTLGIAASNSMTTLSVSLTFPEQNSETNTAAPRPKGTAINIARKVTLSVPTMSARTPNFGVDCDVGNHSVEKMKSLKKPENPSFARNGAPSRKTKKKMLK